MSTSLIDPGLTCDACLYPQSARDCDLISVENQVLGMDFCGGEEGGGIRSTVRANRFFICGPRDHRAGQNEWSGLFLFSILIMLKKMHSNFMTVQRHINNSGNGKVLQMKLQLVTFSVTLHLDFTYKYQRDQCQEKWDVDLFFSFLPSSFLKRKVFDP